MSSSTRNRRRSSRSEAILFLVTITTLCWQETMSSTTLGASQIHWKRSNNHEASNQGFISRILQHRESASASATTSTSSETTSTRTALPVRSPPPPSASTSTLRGRRRRTSEGFGEYEEFDELDDDSIGGWDESNYHIYGGGLVPEENKDEIDCAKFEHLDELPPFCLENNGTSSGAATTPAPALPENGTQATTMVPSSESSPTSSNSGGAPEAVASDSMSNPSDQPPTTPLEEETETIFLENSIHVPLSLGIHLIEVMTEERARVLVALAVRVMSILLDRYTPFDVISPNKDDDDDEYAYYEDRNKADRHGGDGGRHRHRHRQLSGDQDDDNVISDVDEVTDGGIDVGDGSDGGVDAADATDARNNNDGSELLARLYFSSVAVWESPIWDNWLQLSVEYVVFWPNGEPVGNQRLLGQIETACQQVLNMTVDANKFWTELLHEDEDGRFVHQIGEPWSSKYVAAIEAVEKFGAEYELVPDGLFPGGAGDNASMSWGNDKRSQEYSQPLVTEWQFREWFGLGMCLLTIVTATLLTAISAQLQRRHVKRDLWGGRLTEQGVGELLNLGWAYHQQEQDEDGAAGQLFLQVYNKGKLGYNDENSVLQGGVQRPRGASVEISATATTSTPDQS